MTTINKLFGLTSLSVLLVTLERFSFTTKILLQPYSFMRLHEIVQMTILILLTVVIPLLILKEVSHNFKLLQTRAGFWVLLLFVIGVYFYATGNGIHEVSSFNFNHFCEPDQITDQPCGSMFFNDYYTGNIFYFVGAVLFNTPLLWLEHRQKNQKWDTKQLGILIVNALFYSLAIFAYAAFDRVIIGLVFSLVMMGISGFFLTQHLSEWRRYPLITYSTIAYTVGSLGAVLVRLLLK